MCASTPAEERYRHLQPKLELFGPLRVVGVEVVRGALDSDDACPDMRRERVRPRPVLGIPHGPGFDGRFRGTPRPTGLPLQLHRLGPESVLRRDPS